MTPDLGAMLGCLKGYLRKLLSKSWTILRVLGRLRGKNWTLWDIARAHKASCKMENDDFEMIYKLCRACAWTQWLSWNLNLRVYKVSWALLSFPKELYLFRGCLKGRYPQAPWEKSERVISLLNIKNRAALLVQLVHYRLFVIRDHHYHHEFKH